MPQLRSTELREKGDRARDLAKLKEHPSWNVLRKEFETRKAAYLDQLARELMTGGEDTDPLNQRKLDYRRGFLRGALAVLDAPDNALNALETALRKDRHE